MKRVCTVLGSVAAIGMLLAIPTNKACAQAGSIGGGGAGSYIVNSQVAIDVTRIADSNAWTFVIAFDGDFVPGTQEDTGDSVICLVNAASMSDHEADKNGNWQVKFSSPFYDTTDACAVDDIGVSGQDYGPNGDCHSSVTFQGATVLAGYCNTPGTDYNLEAGTYASPVDTEFVLENGGEYVATFSGTGHCDAYFRLP